MLELNTHLFYVLSKLNTLPGIWLIADLPIFFLPIFLTWMWLYHTFIKKDDTMRLKLLHIFYACVLGVVCSYIIKQFIQIERPDSYLEVTGNLIMSHLPENSFPSEHANVSFAFLTALFLSWFKKVGWYFLPFVLLMNISRIIVWVHWPLDIIVWTIVWITSAIVFMKHIVKLKLVKTLDLIIIKIMKSIKLY